MLTIELTEEEIELIKEIDEDFAGIVSIGVGQGHRRY